MAIRDVAVILHLNKDYDRKIAAGISQYAHENGNWRVYLEDDPANRMPDLARWQGHGVIAYLDEKVVPALVRLDIPIVGIGGDPRPELVRPGIAYLAPDNVRIAHLAAEHLLERGLRHFAYCGLPYTPDTSWALSREQAFRDRLAAAGFPCISFHGHHRRTARWKSLLDELAGWLTTLPLPLGLMACDDSRARHVVLACRRAGLAVPDDVAVVGVDNDEIMCDLVQPPLTSVEQGARQVGYEAAILLEGLIRRPRSKRPFRTIPPVGIVARGSTDILKLDDAIVARALAFIRAHVAEPIQAADVARHVHLSRPMLDLRFRRAISRSVYGEICRSRLGAVQHLLAETELPLRAIALRTGFKNAEYLVTTFRRWTGQTPGQHRKANRC